MSKKEEEALERKRQQIKAIKEAQPEPQELNPFDPNKHIRSPPLQTVYSDASKKIREDDLKKLIKEKKLTPQQRNRIIIYGTTGLVSALALLATFAIALGIMDMDTRRATDTFIIAFLFGVMPYGYFANRQRKRSASIDEKFPDLIRDLAESARAGMTLPRALVTAANGGYGELDAEIKIMAAQVEWGISFTEVLQKFSKRMPTNLIKRTVRLIVEAQRAGGNMVDILTAASNDAREIKQIIDERNAQMSIYNVVIFVAFGVFIAVVVILSNQFIPAFKEAVDAAGGGGQSVGGIQFKEFDPNDFTELFFHAALVQAIGGGLVGGVLSKGDLSAGFMTSGIMTIISWGVFRFAIGDYQASTEEITTAALLIMAAFPKRKPEDNDHEKT